MLVIDNNKRSKAKTLIAIRRKIMLVSLLLPRENVPEECVIRVIASIRNSNVKLTKRLLQWIISIYDMVDSVDGQFKNTYPILFHYLTIDAIRYNKEYNSEKGRF